MNIKRFPLCGILACLCILGAPGLRAQEDAHRVFVRANATRVAFQPAEADQNKIITPLVATAAYLAGGTLTVPIPTLSARIDLQSTGGELEYRFKNRFRVSGSVASAKPEKEEIARDDALGLPASNVLPTFAFYSIYDFNYDVKLESSDAGVAYYHPIASWLNVGAFTKRYSWKQENDARSSVMSSGTIVSTRTIFFTGTLGNEQIYGVGLKSGAGIELRPLRWLELDFAHAAIRSGGQRNYTQFNVAYAGSLFGVGGNFSHGDLVLRGHEDTGSIVWRPATWFALSLGYYSRITKREYKSYVSFPVFSLPESLFVPANRYFERFRGPTIQAECSFGF